MKERYRLRGDFIRQVDVRNTDGKEEKLLGVSVQKMFIPSIANTVGTDFTKYKVVKRGQFTYIPDTSRRGDKIGIAFLTDYDEGLVSNSTLDFPAENRVPTGMQNSPESIKAFAVFDVTFNIYS